MQRTKLSQIMAKIHNVSSWSEYAATAEECQVRVAKYFSYFYGNEDPATKKSWCPDCVIAEPVIRDGLKLVPADAEVLHVAVGERAVWKDPENVYRKELRVKCIPTVVKFVDGEETARLEDLDCAAPDTVNAFFQNWEFFGDLCDSMLWCDFAIRDYDWLLDLAPFSTTSNFTIRFHTWLLDSPRFFATIFSTSHHLFSIIPPSPLNELFFLLRFVKIWFCLWI